MSVFPSDVVWLDNVEDDGQRYTAVGNYRQSPGAKKVKKSSDDAATDRNPGALVIRCHVAWQD